MHTLKIANELSKLPTIQIGTVTDLQGTLKHLDPTDAVKLFNRIQTEGFKYPLYVWFDKKGANKPYIIDGHQRQSVLIDNYGVECEIPYIEISAKNKRAAKKELLALNSNFGKMTDAGYTDFIIDFTEADFTELELTTTFAQDFTVLPKWYGEREEEREEDNTVYGDSFALKEGDKDPFQQMSFVFSDAQFLIVKEAIEKQKKSELFGKIDVSENKNANANALFLIVKQWFI